MFPIPVLATPGLLTALGAALVFGVYLFLYKRSFSNLPATVYLAANETVGLVWYAGIAVVTWPAGRRPVPPGTTTGDVLGLAVVLVAVAAANLLTIRAFKLGEISYVAPLNKLVPVFVLPIEVVVLAAALGPLQVVGVLLAALAIYLANYEGGGLLAPFRRALAHTPARLALAGAVLFAVADVGTRGVLTTTAFTPQAVALATFAGVAVVTVPLAVPRVDPAELRAALPRLAALSGLFAVGVHLTTVSFAVAPASLVSPVVNAQAIVAVLLGGFVLDERGLGRRLAAAVLAVGGIALVALG